VHQVRVKNVGLDEQEIHVDGVQIDAPIGTLEFTGPAATLLQLQLLDNGLQLFVDGIPAEAFDPQSVGSTADVLWWKFTVEGSSGMHQVRVKNIALPQREIIVDGAPLDAPAGTTTFTGPGGALLQLEEREGAWVLLVDGQAAEGWAPEESGQLAPVDVAWWKFALPGSMSMHQVRVKNLGGSGQEIYVDGAFLEAPDGTKAFTGPAGTLIELQVRFGDWVLLVDGRVAERHFPDVDGNDLPLLWEFEITGAGNHQVRVEHAGKRGQAVYIDQVHVPGPQGQMTFTGPAGCLLDLQPLGDGTWGLLVDGVQVDQTLVSNGASGKGSQAFTFLSADGHSHELRLQVDSQNCQSVFIDGVIVPAPSGQTAFTGPAGLLLELRPSVATGYSLFVDGVNLWEHNSRCSSASAALPVCDSALTRAPVAVEAVGLPQGVSYCRESGKYSATIRLGGRFQSLGEFATPEEAAAKYAEAKQRAA
jgi:hypothetical protein